MRLKPGSRYFDAFRRKKGQYPVKSEHLSESGEPVFVNQLIESSSPYLLQHAHNPVEWLSWSEAAFEQAKQANKPVFLSIGYATCHWCHVMEKESFEDTEVAAFLNAHFVSIKVDREQHPVVDDFYMTSVQLIQGQGGWPLSAFLLPDGAPFIAATYFPKDRFLSVLQQVHHLWQTQPDQLETQGRRVHNTVTRYLSGQGQSGMINWDAATQQLADDLMAIKDQVAGGFGTAPKFPQEAWLQFLLYHHLDSQDEATAHHVRHSLEKMQTAGIWDWVAGGFHRYTVDEVWLVPHFEKMLYNQAQLLLLYAQAAVVFEDDGFAKTARNLVRFVASEMEAENGLFYAALDADSVDADGVSKEGAYYVWSWSEWQALLSEAELRWLQHHFDIQPQGNFEGQHILYLKRPLTDDAMWFAIQSKLQNGRAAKVRPITDDKTILSWHAMMTEALAWAGHLLGDQSMQQKALAALDVAVETHHHAGQWFRISLSGSSEDIPAVLSDLAHLVSAMWAIHETGLRDLSQSLDDVLSTIKAQFWWQGQLVKAPSTQQLPAIVNAKDGAVVSATAKVLAVLAAFKPDKWSTWRAEILQGLGGAIEQQNTAHAGVFTAQLMAKNHVLGQRSVNRKGLEVRWQPEDEGWVLSLKSPKHWHWQSLEVSVDGGKPQSIPEPEAMALPQGVKSVRVTWQPCDDQRCWPSQHVVIYLV